MTLSDIAKHRLDDQQIVDTKFITPKEIVSWLGAVQAQDYAMAKWAIGLRLPNFTDNGVEESIANGDIVRTHVLRPTWHFVSYDDIRWMLKLTAPYIKATASSIFKKLGLNNTVFKKSNVIIEKSLEGGKCLTRGELMTELKKSGIITDDLRSAHLMLAAELDGVVCNGPRRAKQFTYALLDEKVPQACDFKKDVALAELAKRYFTSHGPASAKDFTWWSGLSVTDAKAGLEEIKSTLLSEKIGAETYWFSNSIAVEKTYRQNIHLLPAYDEFMVSYKDRSASLNSAYFSNTITNNGIFKPIIVVNGKVTGVWKRIVKRDAIVIETELFNSDNNLLKQKLLSSSSVKKYEKFLGMKAQIV